MTTQTLDRYRGHAHTYDVIMLGYNYRINEIASALGIVQLDRLEKNNQIRKFLTGQYQKFLSIIKELTIPFKDLDKQIVSSHHIFPILLKRRINRKLFMERMQRQGVQCSIHYRPIHTFSIYRKIFKYNLEDLPITEEVGKREVTLPLYPQLNQSKIKKIADKVKKAIIF
jgi:dTDP-4-amino-4,6-dideoxygalactose transaminase